MSVRTTTEKRLLCPSCGRKGKRVGRVTLRALLKDEFADEITPPEQSGCDTKGDVASGCRPPRGDTGWRFCDSADCDVVYFAEQSGTTFTKSQIRITVGVKQKTGERPLCYCFGHSVANINEELRMKGQSHALDDIRRKMKDPGCRCEVTNPSGSCCLGSVAKGIETAKQELVSAESDKVPPPGISTTNRGERIAKIGTVISAIVASSCCWLPLLLLAVGVSGAGIAARLEAYRSVFTVVTFGFLTAAFYFTYRRRKSICSAEDACCGPEAIEATEDCGAPAGKRRLSMMTTNKVMLWVVTLLAVPFLFFPHYVGPLPSLPERREGSKRRRKPMRCFSQEEVDSWPSSEGEGEGHRRGSSTGEENGGSTGESTGGTKRSMRRKSVPPSVATASLIVISRDASSSAIVPIPCESTIVAPVALERFTENVSLASRSKSSKIGTAMAWEVSPAQKSIVPSIAAKSLPAVAVPSAVAESTETGSGQTVDSVTSNTAVA